MNHLFITIMKLKSQKYEQADQTSIKRFALQSFRLKGSKSELKSKLKTVELLVLTLTLLLIVFVAVFRTLNPIVPIFLFIDVSLLLLYYARLTYSLNGNDLYLGMAQNFLIYITPLAFSFLIWITMVIILYLMLSSYVVSTSFIIQSSEFIMSLGVASLLALVLYIMLETPTKTAARFTKHKKLVSFINIFVLASVVFYVSILIGNALSVSQPVNHVGLAPFNLWVSACNSTSVLLGLTNGGPIPLTILNATIQSNYYSKSHVFYISNNSLNHSINPDNYSTNQTIYHEYLIERNMTFIEFPYITCLTKGKSYTFNISITYAVKLGNINMTFSSFGEITDIFNQENISYFYILNASAFK